MARQARVKNPVPVKASSAPSKPKAPRQPDPAVEAALELGVLNDVMGFRLRRIQNHLAKAFMDDPRHADMKSGLYSILALVSANPGVSQGRLAQEAGIDKTALVALLDGLEEGDLAVRVRSREDRRKHALHITEKGARTLDHLTGAAHDAEAKARGALTQQELGQLLGILDKLYATCFREEEL
jgi:DNA-binding MarR family transcriptional regulator